MAGPKKRHVIYSDNATQAREMANNLRGAGNAVQIRSIAFHRDDNWEKSADVVHVDASTSTRRKVIVDHYSAVEDVTVEQVDLADAEDLVTTSPSDDAGTSEKSDGGELTAAQKKAAAKAAKEAAKAAKEADA